ncbi:Neutral ceramidase precursor [Dermatophilus congolensis]|uniref:Neutral ceramidase n=2 Tax=Dermatophilus congolensis TaxID=1863 RepID=A0A239V7J4_9MICO|nr:Neutral ceramidase precursor [Dermatophilus congolensis]
MYSRSEIALMPTGIERPAMTRRTRKITLSKIMAPAVVVALALPAGTAFAAQPHVVHTPAVKTDGSGAYLVGSGMYDITGAAAETGMFGYAASQEVDGLHMRLYSRAFVVADQKSGKRVAMVTTDMGAMFPSITSAVVAKLQQKFGDKYTSQNVLIAATHTHVGNSGMSGDRLYQVAGADSTSAGYDKKNFDTVVNGIVESISRAHTSLAPGTVQRSEGELKGATRNRSLPAHRANKNPGSEVDSSMTQLEFRRSNGQAVGVLNWFAIHPTSFSRKFTKLSGDNKGYASYMFEKQMGGDPNKAGSFVAAFANSAVGDVVPAQGNAHSAPGYGGSSDEYHNTHVAGEAQLGKARQLWAAQGHAQGGPVDFRSRHIDLRNYIVYAKYAGGKSVQLCKAARGFSFASGGENGPSKIPGMYEGMTRDSFSISDKIKKVDTSALGGLTRLAFAGISALHQDKCHAEKPILLPTGAWKMVSSVVQVQLVRVGNTAVLALPVEPTTVASRRLQERVAAELAGTGVNRVVIAGVANGYNGYLATREEYAAQHYEGASTEFGPFEFAAFEQEAAGLASAMKKGAAVSDAASPAGSFTAKTPARPGVLFDSKPAGQQFGQVLEQPSQSYSAGQVASAVFRAGHPKNDYRTMGSFLQVQRQEGGQWKTVRTDRDWDTTYAWKREGVAFSRATVQWRIPKGTPAGTYRLVQTGDWKNARGGKVSPYVGMSRSFTVR